MPVFFLAGGRWIGSEVFTGSGLRSASKLFGYCSWILSSVICALLLSLSQAASAGTFASSVWANGPAPPSDVTQRCLTGDFNGDGLIDIVCYTGTNGDWAVGISTGSGFSTTHWLNGPAPGTPIGNQCFVGDFNGDGRTDIACYTGADGKWAISLSNGTGFQDQQYWIGPAPAEPVGDHCMTGDFNGDGMTDIACYGVDSTWGVGLATGSSFNFSHWTGGASPGNPITLQCFTGDFNGDGMTDFGCYTNANNQWAISLSTGTGFADQQYWIIPDAPGVPVTDHCTPGDFNGDGLTDIACYMSGGVWVVALSTGTGFSSGTWNNAVQPPIPIGNRCFSGDVTGDGLGDLTCYTGSNSQWAVSPSNGTSFAQQIWSSGVGPTTFNTQCLTGDFNGDGKADFACYLTSDGKWNVGLAAP